MPFSRQLGSVQRLPWPGAGRGRPRSTSLWHGSHCNGREEDQVEESAGLMEFDGSLHGSGDGAGRRRPCYTAE